MRFPHPPRLSAAQTVERVIGPLAFGLEHDLQETAEVARRPSLEFEPAKILGRQRMERAPPVTAEGHGPSAQLLPIGRGLVRIHDANLARNGTRWKDWPNRFHLPSAQLAC